MILKEQNLHKGMIVSFTGTGSDSIIHETDVILMLAERLKRTTTFPMIEHWSCIDDKGKRRVIARWISYDDNDLTIVCK